MKPDRKPRADSILDTALSDAQREELARMLMSGAGQEDALAWLSQSCGVLVRSKSTLTQFYQRHCAPMVRDRRKFSVVKAEALGDAMSKDPVNWDDKIVERTKQLAFEFLSAETIEPDAVKALLDALTKANKQQLDRERFEEARRKALKADEASEITNNDELSEADKAARIKQLFRMG